LALSGIRTVVLLPPSPVEDASRRSRRVVRSFCCDRHRRVGFDGSLLAFDFRLAPRALLGRHRPARAFARGPASQRSFVRQVCHGSLPLLRSDSLLVALSVRAAPANEPSPLRRSRAPEPTAAGRTTVRLPSAAPRVSHPLRALTVPCAFPGLFHPGPALGVPPFRAFTSCRAVTPLGALLPS